MEKTFLPKSQFQRAKGTPTLSLAKCFPPVGIHVVTNAKKKKKKTVPESSDEDIDMSDSEIEMFD